MLASREARMDVKLQLIEKYNMSLVSFSMNIAGEIKRTPLIELAFDYGYDKLIKRLGEPFTDVVQKDASGCFAALCYDIDAEELKKICVEIEDTEPLGRLFDMDVMNSAGIQLRRGDGRKCLICGGDAFSCGRSRSHGLEAVICRTEEILVEFATGYIASQAVSSLIEELELTPKPGLVDLNNCGAHSDMDYLMMRKSAFALEHFFAQALRWGYDNCDLESISRSKVKQLRNLGVEAEKRMFEITGGVNTHRGAIYGMGILLAASGSTMHRKGEIRENSKKISAALEVVNTSEDKASNGSKVKMNYGIGGACEEALQGFNTAFEAMKYFESALQSRECDKAYKRQNQEIEKYQAKAYEIKVSKLRTLMFILSKASDTNLVHRGGISGLEFAREEAMRILSLPDDELLNELTSLDEKFTDKNLSPGGSADLLAECLFLYKMKKAHVL